jgi:hypothetical protein
MSKLKTSLRISTGQVKQLAFEETISATYSNPGFKKAMSVFEGSFKPRSPA